MCISKRRCHKFRGKYLSRRIPYASNGSFNPFAISNKEVHIVNGNINNLETSELYKEKKPLWLRY